MADELVCWNCGGSLSDILRPISRHVNCSHCFEVLHCCRMCRHYEPEKRPYCGHERAEPPVEKSSANFCDYFRPANRFDASDASRSDEASSDFNALFDQSDAETFEQGGVLDGPDPDETVNRLNDLFDD